MSELSLVTPSSTLFKEYDIRGVIGEDLNRDTYYTLGLTIGSELQDIDTSKKILVCYDSRASSEIFAEALKRGLLLSGIQVIDIGCLPTPVLHFAMRFLNCPSSLMVTASHNPIDYNGLKISIAGKNYHGALLKTLYYRMIHHQLRVNEKNEGAYIQYPSELLVAQYIQAIKADLSLPQKLRVVVDCGNAVAGKVVPQLLTSLGCEVIPLYCDVQETFTNHHPDPAIEENLADLCRVVQEQKADIGMAFDGDGDRLGVVDNKGTIIPSDRLLLAFAAVVLNTKSNPTVVFDVKCTQQLHDYILAHGGIPVMTRTGMAHIMSSMAEHQAILGGEFCGHFYFKDRWLDYDDGIYAAARTLEMLGEQANDVHTYFKKFPKSINTSELKIPISEHKKEAFMRQLLEQAPKFLGGTIVRIDGLRVSFANAWGLIRPSNTGPWLTLRFEAKTESDLQQIKLLFRELITIINPFLELPF
ncbi:phosphomannomutase/phosphoglucomutase [Legionella maioricensis]|uniref:phosphomannomutase n=1 Tax=Legionella maioricensis TaxID=2896528 RepID=A0A9X2IBU6_9GAMM|nr:phosphomannomutase/phosphoglucomutase [Legionella maioricensis]MCL9683048.1 phosphomannomutase/phosphoglucomutase [Legionella maioricensis]MCL9686396.1 phosphomannomutase/phosphoglucomutase [Legionella maioricensis]